jgi:hypothetical protein
MATATSLRDVARRLEAEVASHGCGLASCYCADVEEALLPPAPPTRRPWLLPAFRVRAEPPTPRPAATKRTGEHLAIPEGIEAQELATFAGELSVY